MFTEKEIQTIKLALKAFKLQMCFDSRSTTKDFNPVLLDELTSQMENFYKTLLGKVDNLLPL
jgi:hypothetical protein